jgi:quercetin dioxygenase-like cupin family protein
MANFFIVVGDAGFDLDQIADQLREQIPGLPPDQPQLAKKKLAVQAGVMEALVVVRGHENPHTHPDADLIFTVLEGGGWLQRSAEPNPEIDIEISAGGTVVVPKGVCHAFHNTCDTDSVLLATFSPGIPTAADGCAPAATDSLADTRHAVAPADPMV